MTGKIVPHAAVPAGSSVGHGAVLSFAAVAEPPAGVLTLAAGVPEPPGPAEVRELVDKVNGVLQSAGLGRPVLGAERFLVAMRLAEEIDEDAVLRALRAPEQDEDLRQSLLWWSEEAERPIFDRDPPDEPGRGAEPPAGDSRTVPH